MSEKDRRGPRDEIQGELEGLIAGDPAPGVPPPEALEREEPPVEPGDEDEDAEGGAGPDETPPGATATGEEDAGEPVASGPDAPDAEVDRLARTLDALEERVTLLLGRHEDLARRHQEAVEELGEKDARLGRLREAGEDPEELVGRIRELEDDNDRLSRHAEFLERRIESLLNRVRYVVES